MGAPRLQGSVIGNGFRWLRNPYALLDSALAAHGLSFYARLPVLGDTLVTGDPELIRAIVKNRDLVGGRGTRALRPVLGDDALIVLEGEAHAARRKLLSAAFKAPLLRRHDAATVDCCLREIERLPRGSPFSLFQLARRVTLVSIVRVLFGRLAEERERRLYGLIDNYMHSFSNPLFLFVRALQRDWGRYSPWGRLQLHRRALRSFVDEEMANRRGARRDDDSVFGRMLAVAPAHSDESLFNEILSLLLFGHDTSAVTLAWLFYHVYSDAGLLTRLRDEAAAVADISDQIDSRERSLMRCCVMESMRLCPVVVHLTRVATRDLELGGHRLREGDKVLPSAYLAQHNADVFADPYRFEPARFTAGQNYHYSFFPFGLGLRKCIGEQLAQRQIQSILYSFLNAADLELEPQYRASAERNLLLVGPADGTQLRIRS